MLQNLRKKIESKRGSNNLFWETLVFFKDFLWSIYFCLCMAPYFMGDYFLSWYLLFKNRKLFRKVRTYCMFIGYARSGHTLIGSLLDAHPNIIIANELDTLKFLRLKFTRGQIYSLLLNDSIKFTEEGRISEGYSYLVNGQFNGRFNELLVIGDKKGDWSNRRILKDEKIILKLYSIFSGQQIKYIHVIRNPYDNITTISRKEGIKLNQATDYYFILANNILKIKNKVGYQNVLDIKHEELIKNPKKELKKLCEFLDVKPYEDYLEDCAKIVWKKPHKSRFDVDWTPELIIFVENKIKDIPFLKGYSYKS